MSGSKGAHCGDSITTPALGNDLVYIKLSSLSELLVIFSSIFVVLGTPAKRKTSYLVNTTWSSVKAFKTYRSLDL